MSNSPTTNINAFIERVNTAQAEGKITASAVENLHAWLTEPRYSDYRDACCEMIDAGEWQPLDDVFWTVIPFGTGGRRGRMHRVGSNAINDRTIGESAQGLANYIVGQSESNAQLSCAIAYDTRHNSRHFAELCAGIMVAAGFQVYFLDDYRSTPALSFLVRWRNCDCGIMVTASHNPPSDNAVKVYWSTGGQVLPPHDRGIIDCVMKVEDITSAPFDDAVESGKVEICTEALDQAFCDAVVGESFAGPRDVRVLYSPLHGVGTSAVLPALERVGFSDVEVFEPHARPDGDFPNVPNHVSNPENPDVFTAIIDYARRSGADVALATDPDCDRMGCAAPISADAGGSWRTFTGNQLGILLTDFVLGQCQSEGTLTPDHYVVTTLVTTKMIRTIADSYGAKTYDNLHVGFKWIGGQIDEAGPENFLFGAEESHGYQKGSYTRDKDGVVACMLLCELAAHLKEQGLTLHDRLVELYRQHGFFDERLINQFMEGSEGMTRMRELMARFRSNPPSSLGGIAVTAVHDYDSLTTRTLDGQERPLGAPAANMVVLELQGVGNSVAVRPSGTEPKVKFYILRHVPPDQLRDVEATMQSNAEFDAIAADLRAFADAV